ncbi:hypothetical protein [Devosia sp. FJ2-5-3]|uniref:hypothetical protein n=1 Tax=Devosia sp. FJ2-5-3 TaxID=2976680 RepID=UPI0023D86876|nr:hypothetical protein [Devosia sp. FJ2-5-3]WEJ60204.1 hypothetical protein N0P34_09280 [Devosia sp. FJ2-5-3]
MTQPKNTADFKRHPIELAHDLPDNVWDDDAPTGGVLVWLFGTLAVLAVGIFIALTVAVFSARGWLA